MYENNRRSFYRDRRDLDDDRFEEDRWPGEGRRGRATRFDTDDEWSRRNRPGHGARFPGDEHGRHGSYGPDNPPEEWRRGSRRERGHWAHDPQHGRYSGGAAAYGYGAGQPYGGEGDYPYFTGQQGSWAVPSSYGARGRRGFGADYRGLGYGSRGYDEDERGFWDRATDEVASWFGDEDAARRREQDHRGRGPQGYTRSDERIREDANDRLTDDPRVDARDITLTVENGEITLNGTVDSRYEKRRAEDVVEWISGVKHVQNNLRVEERATGTPSGTRWTNPAGTSSTAEGGTISQPGTTAAAAGQTGRR